VSDDRIRDSLLALASQGVGDWADVIVRSSAIRTARNRRRLVLALAAAALLIGAGATFAVGRQYFNWFHVSTPPGWFDIEGSKSKAPATKGALPYVFKQTLYRPGKRPQRLAFPVWPVFHEDQNLAVSSPDGRYIVYQTDHISSRGRGAGVFTPALYVHDTLKHREKLIARGGISAAWSRNDRIAYWKADRETYDEREVSAGKPYIGQVMVQTLEGRPVAWTRRAAKYVVLAWVRDEVIVRVDDCIGENCPRNPDSAVYALNRRGRLRPLHMEWLTALSPDGRYAIGPAEVEFENYSPLVRIVRVDSGKVVATLDERRLARRALSGLKPSRHSGFGRAALLAGSWRGDEVVFSLGDKRGSALAVFKWRERKLVYEFSIPIPVRKLPWVDYGPSFYVPFFSGAANREIVATAGGSKNRPWPKSEDCLDAILVCSRTKRSCVVGQSFFWSSVGKRGGFALVTDPSRP
jgi:hypothetical protein